MNLDAMPDTAYHYDVTITPDRPKKFMRVAFEECCTKHLNGHIMIYDGAKSCYTTKRLPKKSCVFEVSVNDSGNRTKEFKIEIKETETAVVELKSLKSYEE